MDNFDVAGLIRQVLSQPERLMAPNALERARWAITDTMFAAWSGLQAPELESLAQLAVSRSGGGEQGIPLFRADRIVSPYDYALLSGTAIVSRELDEGNQFAKGHPSAHVLAPALAAGWSHRTSGKQLLEAFALAYEIAARLAFASNMRDEMHPHGTWGIVGGTVAAGLLGGRSEDDIIEAALIAAALPLATSWQAAVTGMTARNLYAGIGSRTALEALDYQACGFKSSNHVAGDVWSSLMSVRADASKLTEHLGDPPLIERNYFKLYPSCRFSHSAIDAMEGVLAEGLPDVRQIERIVVETYSLAARLDDLDPRNELAARFSIPFLLAVVAHGADLFELEQPHILEDTSIRELAARIVVREAQDLTARLPALRSARVTLELSGGVRRQYEAVDAAGGYQDEGYRDKLRSKFVRMMHPLLTAEQVERIAERVLSLDRSPDVRVWFEAITGEGDTGEH